MSYHSHKLNSASHSHIIGRTDPITSDTIKENDKVVFCLNCHSCFLEESWIYMNNAHCQQNQTLSFVPLPAPQLIAKKKAQKLIAELKESELNPFPSIIAFTFFIFLFLITAVNPILSFVLSLFFSIVVGITFKSQKIIITKPKGLYIYEEYIQLDESKFFWNQISQINFKRAMRVEFDERYGTEKVYSYTPSLEIHFKNGDNLVRDFPTKNYYDIKPFLFGLAWASQFTTIHFYTEHEKEYGIVQSLDRNYQGNLKIEEPKQLKYNPEEN